MAITNIPEKVKIRLWGKAAGRCQYEGCNKPLWLDTITKAEFNVAYIAHIIADNENGPRGDPTLSKELASDISNLMLLCDPHHRLIDIEDVKGHSVQRLRTMKEKHERRIEIVSGIQDNKQSHVLLYGANIGDHTSPVSYSMAAYAMLPEWYPAETIPLSLGMKNSSYQEMEPDFWKIERNHLISMYNNIVRPRLAQGDIEHLSVFAVAPQPLLMLLGFLISELINVNVFQLQHETKRDWKWQSEIPPQFEYIVHKSDTINRIPVVILALSAPIATERITTVLGEDVTIWYVTISEPHNDFLKSPVQLSDFRKIMRRILDQIKHTHDEQEMIHVFPAMPVALAVELGRVIMPKADAPLRIYDENNKLGGFVHALDINA